MPPDAGSRYRVVHKAMPMLRRPRAPVFAPTPQTPHSLGGDSESVPWPSRRVWAQVAIVAIGLGVALLGPLACAGRSGSDADADAVVPAQAPSDTAGPVDSARAVQGTASDPNASVDGGSADAVVAPGPKRLDQPPQDLPPRYLAFDRACERGDKEITIAAVGDLLIHRELQKQAFADDAHFRGLWTDVEPLLSRADIAYANLEGPTAQGIDRWGKERKDPGFVFDNKVYSGYARFNYHPQLVQDLVSSGFDIVSTANNHSLDRGALGVDRTIDALVAAKLPYTGTRRQGDTKAPWHGVTQVSGITIAWLACTLHTNYQKDDLGQVLRCFDDPKQVPRLVRKLVKDPDIDAVIVTPHWGKEYKHEPIGKQRRLAQAVFDAGALAVLGSHPHVLQPWETLVGNDGRQGLAMYSMGNFASHQRDLPRRSSAIVYLGLTQGSDGQLWVNGARYLPITVRMEGDKERFAVEAVDAERGPTEVYDHVTGLMGTPNRLGIDEVLRTNPQCYSDWTPPRR